MDDIIHHDGLTIGWFVTKNGKAISNLMCLLKCINFKVVVIILDLAPKMLPISGQGLVGKDW